MNKKSFVVHIEHDDQGWLASIPGLDDCHTKGRTLSQARSSIRYRLGQIIGEEAAGDAEIVDEIRFPRSVAKALKQLHQRTTELNELRAQLDEDRRAAISGLTSLGVNAHDDVGALIEPPKPGVAIATGD